MRSLRRQLTIGLLAAFTLLLGVGGALVYWAVRESLYGQFDSALRLKALVVVTDTQISNGRVRVHFSDRFLREFDRTVATDFFQVFDAQGDTVAKSDSLGTWRLPGKLKGPLEKPVYWNLTLPNGDRGRAIGIEFQPRVRSGELSQLITVVVVANRQPLLDTLAKLRTVLVSCGAGLLGLTAIVVPIVLRRDLRPLGEVAARAAQIDARSLSHRFPIETMPAELRPVGEKLNELLARLEASFERERRFSSDLAHELRTPLAELRSQAELALKWPEERSPDTDKTVLEIAIQLEMLISRLLTLSRAEQAQGSLHRAEVRLKTLVEEQLRRQASHVANRRLTVEHTLTEDAVVTTDPVLLESILSNLIGNAVAYAPEQSRVHVTHTQHNGCFVFSVSNFAPELAPTDLPLMFDRFWRKDKARTGSDHAGLGLALSRSFAHALGFSIDATLSADGVLTLSLRGAV
jgi:signal transduction histidine kinase